MDKVTDQKLVLVTGGTKGIGRAVVLTLLQQGYLPIINYSRDSQSAQTFESELKSLGYHDFVFMQGDIARRETSLRILKMARDRFNAPIAFLVNNAGILNQGDFFALTEEQWDRTLAVNLKGPFHTCQELMPQMQGLSAAIVNVVSIGGQTGGPKAPDYAASKGALMTFTQSMARLGSAMGIRVNAVSPGWINTGIFSEDQLVELTEEARHTIPLGRMGDPAEVANVIVFLLSEQASYITGQIINVNGGMYF